MIFECPRCKNTFNKKFNFERHVNRKFPCKVVKTGKNISLSEYYNILSNPIDVIEIIELREKNIKLEQKITILENNNKELKIILDQKENQKLENEQLTQKNRKLTLKLSKYEKGGYIYVLHNPIFESYGDSVYKVGCSRNPQLRLKDFSTSYATESIIVYQSEFFNNKLLAEKELFNKLSKYRYNKSREFFDIPLDKIIEYISNITM